MTEFQINTTILEALCADITNAYKLFCFMIDVDRFEEAEKWANAFKTRITEYADLLGVSYEFMSNTASKYAEAHIGESWSPLLFK